MGLQEGKEVVEAVVVEVVVVHVEVVMEITMVVMEVVMVQITVMVVVMGVAMVVMVVMLNKLPREAEDRDTRLIRRGESSTIVVRNLAANNIALTLGKRWLPVTWLRLPGYGELLRELQKCLKLASMEATHL